MKNPRSHLLPRQDNDPLPPLPRFRLSDFVLWLRGRRQRRRVVGSSFQPVLRDGDTVFFQTLDSASGKSGAVMVGDYVLADHPFRRIEIIKFVRNIKVTASGERTLWIEGAVDTGSEDSRSFGWLALTSIKGKLTSRV